MKFDIKDVKSWANRHDVKVGDDGYFANDIYFLDDIVSMNLIGTIEEIDENDALCFKKNDTNNFAFFLPLDAVKKDKLEKKYRPFKDLYEFYKFLAISPLAKEDFSPEMLLKFCFTYREKCIPQYTTTIVITRIDFGLDSDPCSTYINNKDFEDWFDNYEFMNSNGEWVPFGVEVEDD